MNTIVQSLSQKREFVKGKIIISIDPAKDKPKVRIIDANGILESRSFSSIFLLTNNRRSQ